MSAGYMKRRERMRHLQSAFRKLGFERAMFLFRKYAHGSAEDYEELLDKAVPPWYISDDTCSQRPSPPVAFTQVFMVVLSTADAAGERYRRVLRGHTDAASVWLQRLSELGSGMLRWIFVAASREDPGVTAGLAHERDEHRDILLVSNGGRPAATLDETSAEQLLHVLTLLRDFQFRWLVISRQDVLVQPERLLAALHVQEPPVRKALGSWRDLQDAASVGAAALASVAAAAASSVVDVATTRESARRLDPHFFALSRDVFSLLSAPEVSSRLVSWGRDLALGDLARIGGGLNAWLRALAVQQVALPGMHMIGAGAGTDSLSCPPGTLALHPVSAEQLYSLSRSPGTAC